MKVFVLAPEKTPLMPCSAARARLLLTAGDAAVFRRYPFTIILKRPPADGVLQPLQLKIDPGSKTTGIALVHKHEVIFAMEMTHRGQRIKARLEARRALRRGRRARKTRYRAPRFQNRTHPAGWLPPSLQSRVENIMTWVARLARLCPLGSLSQELVRFDTQLMQNATISGVEYQQGTLAGYEVREYLLEKWQRTCAYCGATDIPLQVEHIQPRVHGGSDRIANLTLACAPCNTRKGTQPLAQFLAKKPDVLKKLLAQAQAKTSLKDTAAVNSTRWTLYARLQATGLPVEVGTGGRTKFNRTTQGYAKAHWIDAACVGASGAQVWWAPAMRPLQVKAMGHGTRQMCSTDAYGFPVKHRTGIKKAFGFQTGDIVSARIPSGKYAGKHVGRITIRTRPSFGLNGFNVHPKYLTLRHHADGYAYSQQPLPEKEQLETPVHSSAS